jgi:predicted metal-dependent enzyme (double-stranded beta helix superfamily)
MNEVTLPTVRECVGALVDAVAAADGDLEQATPRFTPLLTTFLERPDLPVVGIPRQQFHFASSMVLYYDAEYEVILGSPPKDVTLQIHDHGVWQVLALYRGAADHTQYVRTDDGFRPGHADLDLVEHRLLSPGDWVLMAPPSDVHTLTGLTDDTYFVSINPLMNRVRRYFQLDAHTYIERVAGR